MRMNSKMTSLTIIAAAAGLLGMAAAASAGGYHEHAYEDAYGNLIVYSPAGYKEIIVGKGYLAGKLDRTSAATPSQKDEALSPGQRRLSAYYRCAHKVVLLRGRSYMYGLPEHVVPTPAYDLCD